MWLHHHELHCLPNLLNFSTLVAKWKIKPSLVLVGQILVCLYTGSGIKSMLAIGPKILVPGAHFQTKRDVSICQKNNGH